MTVSIALVTLPPLARSQSTSPVIELLLNGRDVRTRVQAATTLGRLRPAGSRQALERALGDGNAAVRAASAQALGQLGDAGARSALQARANDSDPGVRASVARALASLQQQGGGSSAVAAVAPPTADWSRARFALRVGNLNNHVGGRSSIVDVFRNAIMQEVSRSTEVALVPGALPPEAERRVRTGRLRSYAIEGGVNTLRRWTVANTLSVRAEVSLVLVTEPSRVIVGSLSGAATAQDQTPSYNADAFAQRLEDRALAGAVRGALNNLQQSLMMARR